MKRAFVAQSVLCLFLLPGCARQAPRLSPEDLRARYPAVRPSGREMVDLLRLPTVEDLRDVQLIAVVSPVSDPEKYVHESKTEPGTADAAIAEKNGTPGVFSVDYRSIDCTVARVLRGEAPGDALTIALPEFLAGFMDAMETGHRYVVGLDRAEHVGDDVYGTMDEFIFYLSDTDQVVPFVDAESQRKVLGMTLPEFLRAVR